MLQLELAQEGIAVTETGLGLCEWSVLIPHVLGNARHDVFPGKCECGFWDVNVCWRAEGLLAQVDETSAVDDFLV